MSDKLMIINTDQPEECRVVILQDGKIENFIVEHASNEQIKGNIYLGVINRVEPAIEAAFVDFGGKKYGFLPFKDVLRESYIQTGEKKARVRIQDVLVRGQKLLVQVAKEGRDTKGPSLTNEISLPGRFLVLMNGSIASAVSRKIEDDTERKKLKEIVSEFKIPDNTGMIIRTAGVGRTKAELQKDLQMLIKIWDSIQSSVKNETQQPPSLIYQEANMVVRTVRDHLTNDVKEIVVDNPASYNALRESLKMINPRTQGLVRLYKDTKPLFSHYKLEGEIETIYKRNVNLPSGGSLVIDIGEAMASIDVNSGKTTSASALEETALRTNLEAADEIARQLRLRDLGGLIVIDFIDMFQKRNKAQIEKQLKKACKNDKARINISKISKFGLLEMSRQRMSPPVKDAVFENCSHCGGQGHVRSVGSVALNVLRKIGERVSSGKIKEMAVEISYEVQNYLFNHKAKLLLDYQEKHNFSLNFSGKPSLPYEDFKYSMIERTAEEMDSMESKPKETQQISDKPGVEKVETKVEKPGKRGRGSPPMKRPGTRRPKSAARGRSGNVRKTSLGRRGAYAKGRRPLKTYPAKDAGDTISVLDGGAENRAPTTPDGSEPDLKVETLSPPGIPMSPPPVMTETDKAGGVGLIKALKDVLKL